MLLRRIARPLLATSFVYDGVQAAMHPSEHAPRAREGSRVVTERLGLAPLSDSQVTLLVRAHGVATAWAGLMVGLGRAPRTAALALAALTVPLAVVNQPFGSKGGTRSEKTGRFARNLGAIGAALIAGIDTEGRPGMAWRVHHARDRAARATSKVTSHAAGRVGRTARRAEKALTTAAS